MRLHAAYLSIPYSIKYHRRRLPVLVRYSKRCNDVCKVPLFLELVAICKDFSLFTDNIPTVETKDRGRVMKIEAKECDKGGEVSQT